MQMIKYFMLFIILVVCSLIGRNLSRRYVIRVNELEEMKNALNMFQSKIKFTYEPIPEIFEQIAKNTSKSIGQVFRTCQRKNANQHSQHSMGASNRRKPKQSNKRRQIRIKNPIKTIRTNRHRRTNQSN